MKINSNINLNSDEILIRILLKKLGYEKKIIDRVCEIIQ